MNSNQPRRYVRIEITNCADAFYRTIDRLRDKLAHEPAAGHLFAVGLNHFAQALQNDEVSESEVISEFQRLYERSRRRGESRRPHWVETNN